MTEQKLQSKFIFITSAAQLLPLNDPCEKNTGSSPLTQQSLSLILENR